MKQKTGRAQRKVARRLGLPVPQKNGGRSRTPRLRLYDQTAVTVTRAGEARLAGRETPEDRPPSAEQPPQSAS